MPDQMTGTYKAANLAQGVIIISFLPSFEGIIASNLYRCMMFMLLSLVYAKQVYNDKVKLSTKLSHSVSEFILFWLSAMSNIDRIAHHVAIAIR